MSICNNSMLMMVAAVYTEGKKRDWALGATARRVADSGNAYWKCARHAGLPTLATWAYAVGSSG